MKQRHSLVRPSECGPANVGQVGVAPDVLRGADRRWEITKKRTDAVARLIREYSYRVGEVARYLPAQEKKRHSHL